MAMLATAARADQRAPELGALFSALTAAADAGQAAAIEQQIWSHWMAGPEPMADQLLEEARAAADAGQSAAALEVFDRLTTRFPDYAEGWNQRAIMRYLLDDVQGALDDIERVLVLEPRHFGAFAGRGQCYLRLERPRESLTAFMESLRINPWSATVQQQVEALHHYLREQQTPI